MRSEGSQGFRVVLPEARGEMKLGGKKMRRVFKQKQEDNDLSYQISGFFMNPNHLDTRSNRT